MVEVDGQGDLFSVGQLGEKARVDKVFDSSPVGGSSAIALHKVELCEEGLQLGLVVVVVALGHGLGHGEGLEEDGLCRIRQSDFFGNWEIVVQWSAWREMSREKVAGTRKRVVFEKI